MALDRPHFRWPFALAGSSFASVEQDSDDDVASCMAAVLSYPLGSIPSRPTFGVPTEAFLQGGPSDAEIKQALLENEPRAETLVDTSLLTESGIATVNVGFDTEAGSPP